MRDRFHRLVRSKRFWIIVGVIVLLVAVRAVLPIFIERYVNQKLDEIEGYSGHVEDVDLNLFRGAYVIEGVRIVKTDGKPGAPLFTTPEIDISVEWSALLDGAIVAEIEVLSPRINFIDAPSKAQEQKSAGGNWTDTVQDLVPIKINRFAVRDGQLHFRNFHSDPPVNIYVQNANLTVTNLTNSTDLSESQFAHVKADALAMSSGRIDLEGDLDPFAERPTFDLNLSMKGLDVTQLNDFLKAYINADAEGGKVFVYAELKANDGKFRGYVKPIIKDLELIEWREEDEGFLTKLWETLLAGVSELFENHPHDQIATRIPLRGSFDNPDIGIWTAVSVALRNAFIEALRHGVEGALGLGDDEQAQLDR